MTSDKSKANIISEIWMNYRDDESWIDFVEYNDLGLPLGYAIASNIIDLSPRASMYLDETFNLLLESLEIEDTGFETLEEMLAKSSSK